MKKHSLIVYGWRGINHSFAMVNQNQLVCLLNRNDIELYHEDAPYFLKNWNKENNSSGFNQNVINAIDAIPQPSFDLSPDWIYTICFPYIYYRRHVGQPSPNRVATFMVTELGLDNNLFLSRGIEKQIFTENGSIVITPSNWSKDRLTDVGFDEEKIKVVPHGVDDAIFKVHDSYDVNKQRNLLGIKDDDFVFLNLGSMTWNKGIDILIKAFFHVAGRNKYVKLILKDQSALYGITVVDVLKSLFGRGEITNDDEILGRIVTISENFSVAQLASLYNVADCYVSPYYAEGFNLPVIEAAACGSHVIVTAGGATDDFCPDFLTGKVESNFTRKSRDNEGGHLCYREPSLDNLIQLMDDSISQSRKRNDKLSRFIHEQFSWRKVSEKLVESLRH